MADTKLTALTELAEAIAPDDKVYVVDISDTTDSAAGTSKFIQASNAISYARTTAEASAGVTPTNYQYEPGNVLRYGTNTTPGTTDMTTAISNATAAAGSTGWVDFPAGTYAVSTLAITSNVRWRSSDGAATIKCSNTGTNQDDFITVTGSVSTDVRGITFDGNSEVGRLLLITNSTDQGAGETVNIDGCRFINSDNNTVRSAGISVVGGFDRVNVTRSLFRNLNATGSSGVSSGVHINSSSALYCRQANIDGCEFDDITPVADADGINAGAATGTMNDSNLVVTNCTFRDCHKRAVKSQMYSAYVAGNHIERTADHSQTGNPEIAIQFGGGTVVNNKFFYSDGAYGPSLIVQVDNNLNASTPTSHLSPSRVEGNLVYVGNNTAIDHFVQVNCALSSTGNDYVSVVGNTIHGHLTKFAYLIPNDGDSAHVQIDELLIENNYVRELSGTNFAFIWGNKLDGSEDPDLGTNVEIKARVRDNVVGNSSNAPAYRNAQAGNAYTTGSGVDFTPLEWKRNINTTVPEVSSGVPATVQTLTGAGAVDLTHEITHIVTDSADALTLADGIEDQRKFIVMKTDAGAATLTPTNLGNGSTITFDDVGDSADLLFTNSAWHFMGGTATLA